MENAPPAAAPSAPAAPYNPTPPLPSPATAHAPTPPPAAPTPTPTPREMPPFHKQRHITYWLRCLKTCLPNAYTSLDANRMMAAYFSLAALDLLGALEERTSAEERHSFADWVYGAQHPRGGFRAAPPPGAAPGAAGAAGGGGGGGGDPGDRATVPNTYFALAALLLLRDDLARVRRGACLAWLARCQRADGSVGQYVGEGGRAGGGSDTRFSYMAVGVRWFLRGARGGAGGGGADLDVEGLVRNVGMLQTYDGGFSEVPFREAHGEFPARVGGEADRTGGYVYCAVCALSILDRVGEGVRDMDALIGWLARRQLPVRARDGGDDGEEGGEEGPEDVGIEYPREGVGFNGRCNKVVDSCYSWWICATLKVRRRRRACRSSNGSRRWIDSTSLIRMRCCGSCWSSRSISSAGLGSTRATCRIYITRTLGWQRWRCWDMEM